MKIKGQLCFNIWGWNIWNEPFNKFWQHKRTEIRIKIDSLHKTVALLSCSPHYKIAPCASHDGHLSLNLGIVAVIPYKSWAILRLLKTKTFPPYQLVNLSVCNEIITDGVRALYLQNSPLVSLWHGLIIHPFITGSPDSSTLRLVTAFWRAK